MKKLSKKELAQAIKRSSEELALEAAINAGQQDGCIPGGTVNADLSTPIGSVQDGPRMTGAANFGGKKAMPFGKKKAATKSLVKAIKAKKGMK